MPGNLLSASVIPASTVLPQTLSTSFAEARSIPSQFNFFHDGSNLRTLITDGVNPASSIRTWRLSKRLTTATLTTLRAFWATVEGPLHPFYFYNPFEPLTPTSPYGSNYDSSGTSVIGRHTCKFTVQDWNETTGLGRSDVAMLEFMEIA